MQSIFSFIFRPQRALWLIALAALALTACNSTLPPPPPDQNASTTAPAVTMASNPVPVNGNPQKTLDSAQAQLAETAVSVNNSLLSLQQIQQAATPAKQPKQLPPPSSYGMGEEVSINWNGPVEPLLAKIADLSHYQFKTLGTPPAIPILVLINAKNQPLGDILQNAGYQCGTKADVIVYPATRVIELRYAHT